tara:strand:+ start:149 stop:838 length:690 start_codon:yes stop_codon:yes gene_type:complete
LSTNSIKPKYYIADTATIASSINGESDLKVLWKNEAIENVKSTKVVIWNGGTKYLDRNSISQSKPISISISHDGKILSSKILKTSRASLEFEVTNEKDKDNQNVIIAFVADEALEKNDGLLIEILHTGGDDSELSVTGRVKGVPDGFESDSIVAFELIEKKTFIKVSIAVLIILCMIASLFNLYHGINLYKSESRNCWFCLISGSVMLLISLGASFYLFQTIFWGLTWL